MFSFVCFRDSSISFSSSDFCIMNYSGSSVSAYFSSGFMRW
jgi:hypothetical protein